MFSQAYQEKAPRQEQRAKRYEKYPFTISQDGARSGGKQGFILEFDMYLRAPGAETYRLTKVGEEMALMALINMPVTTLGSKFWGYKGTPKSKPLFQNDWPRQGTELLYLLSFDRKALEAAADVLADERCWAPENTWTPD